EGAPRVPTRVARTPSTPTAHEAMATRMEAPGATCTWLAGRWSRSTDSTTSSSALAGFKVLISLLPLLHGVRGLGEAAALQRLDVGDDGPAVGLGDRLGVARHGPHAVRDDLEELAGNHLADAILVEGRGRHPAAGGDDAPALAHLVVADGAEDVVALLAALHEGGGDLHRVLGHRLALGVEAPEER